jgi:hypothetical protein
MTDEEDEVVTPTKAPMPQRRIDKALAARFKGIDSKSDEVALKIISTAINWEKVKARIQEDPDEFNSDNL